MKKLLLFLIAFTCSFCAFSQTNSASSQTYLNRNWVNYTGHPDNLGLATTNLDNFGNVYVLGSSIVRGNSATILLTKYNNLGNQIWQTEFPNSGSFYDYAISMAFDNNGDVIVLGADSNSMGNLDFLVLKIDTGGSIIWSYVWDDSSHLQDIPTSLSIDNQNNIFVAGTATINAN